jgi:general secretion pathway protein G
LKTLLFKTQIKLLEQSIFDFQLDLKRLPDSENGLRELEKNVANDEKWDGPYLKQNVPKDPWGEEYVYTQPGEHGDFDLMSYGSDKQPGGENEAEDICNWGKRQP